MSKGDTVPVINTHTDKCSDGKNSVVEAQGVGEVREVFSEEVTCERLVSWGSTWVGWKREQFLQREQHVPRSRSKTL